MSQDDHTDEGGGVTDEELHRVVREELAAQTGSRLDGLPVSRRDVLAGLSLLGAGTVAGFSIEELGLIGRARSQAAPEGTLGTASDPLDTVYVATLQQLPDDVDADVLHVGGNQLTIGGSPSSPEAGDVRITEDTS